jgi:hypothetical protein
MGDQADFEQFDIGELAALHIAGEAARAVAEAEAAGLALFQRLPRAAIRIVDRIPGTVY